MEFQMEETFDATPEELFDSWLSSEGHTAMTGGEASITDGEGDDFTAWDGYITGKNLQLRRPGYIKQSWRTSEFPENQPDSLLEVSFQSVGERRTRVILRHARLTDNDHQYEKGWIDHYFQPMKAYFK